MEAFSLLKYWRPGGATGGTGGGGCGGGDIVQTTTIVTAVSDHDDHQSESEEEDNADNFFDLEFTVPDEEDGDGGEKLKSGEINDIICVEENDKEKDESTESEESEGENDGELKFTLSSASSGDSIDPNVSLSPSDDLFFKGRLVPLTESNCKPAKSATKAEKLRVLMLKLKKSTKSGTPQKVESEVLVAETPKQQSEKEENKQRSKFFTVKFKVEEVPIVSLFTRDNSSKTAINKSQKQNVEKSVQDERGFSKDALQKYLKKVKPLYVRVSKRYGEKLGFSGHLSLSGAMKAGLAPPPSTAVAKSPPAAKSETESPKVGESPQRRNVKSQKQGSFPAKLRVVRKHLGKSKSASSAVAASPPGPVVSKRRDDSLMQQEDGIQSAIMHCKRSFKASRDMEKSGLLRSVSDQSRGKSVNESIADEEKAKGEMHLKVTGVEPL